MKKEDFRIVFMGTPEFAVQSLKLLLHDGYPVPAVITAPDRPSGRGQKIQPSAVKIFAEQNRLDILQPTNLKDTEFLQELQSLEAHLFVVVAFRMLPEEVFKMPPNGTINLHASLLPHYRGAAPINWVLIRGEEKTGLTTFFIQKDIDTGHIILQKDITLTNDMTAGELHDILKKKGADLLLETIDLIRAGKARVTPQPSHPNLKTAPRIQKEDCRISWAQNVVAIHNLVRGLSPSPGAWTILNRGSKDEILVKIFKTTAEIQSHQKQPGSISTNHHTYLKIAGPDGFIQVLDLQVAGKKRMTIREFLRGQTVHDGWYCV